MNNQTLLQRSLAAVWHPCTQMKQHEQFPLLPIARGDGVWLEDFDGRRYLDAVSSWWVNLFGHNQPQIKAAIRDQLERIEHVMLAGFTHQPVVELSERLGELTGLGHAFYGSDGASATEVALKMAAHYWRNQGQAGKNRFVYLQHSYHGETLGALAVTDVALFRDAYAPLVRADNFRVMNPDARHAQPGETAQQVAQRAAADLERCLAGHGHEIAALILEPLVQGAAGMAMYHPDYLRRARALCDQYQVLLVADEIAVGFGRTGSMFAYQQAGIVPDLLCLSKGITGGYLPLSSVLCSSQLYTAFYADEVSRGFLHSHSYTGNPLACAAALATLDLFAQTDVLGENATKAARWNAGAFAELASDSRLQHWRHCGMIWAADVSNAPAGFARALFDAGLQQGLLLRPLGSTLYFMPPYILQDDEAQQLAQGCLRALDQVLGG